MTNEDKAKELADFLYFKLSHIDYGTLHKKFLEMAEWKDGQSKEKEQQLIDKACEWLKNNAAKYVVCDESDYHHYAYKTLTEDFKKAMEE